MIEIRDYRPEDERAWLLCRLVSFFGTAYHDDVQTEKTSFTNPSVELVAEENGFVVGLIEVECETQPGSVCRDAPGLGGMVWNLAVHPEFRRRGIAAELLEEARRRATALGIVRFEAYTRDDTSVLAWYEASGFAKVMSYLHVYMDAGETEEAFESRIPGVRPVSVFAHYLGEDRESIRARFRRVHECNLFELRW